MRRPPKREAKIEMTPFLDSLVIMMSLICLVLVVMIMPVIQNPQQYKVLSFSQLVKAMQRKTPAGLQPVYIDCHPDRAVVLPGDISVSVQDILLHGNPIDRLLARIQANADKEYVVLLARPGSFAVFRHLRKELIRRGIVAGSDVLPSNAVLDWKKEIKELNIHLPET
ncbi:MAG: hypothetical protein J5I99_00220 [Verrucomicrobia bacterium]|nr:hypothetical protein [Verrucomicrobiota bacterium]